ncbi:MAG: oligosaccharide flippase family protein [Lactobacillus sp.]|nr:oligosaccharide flippase family protein [Lactobacillus sp.]
MNKVLKNTVYQAIYQVLQIILPLITVPIVSTALGPKGVGIFNYTNSITNYFVLVAGLGLANYGVREIASVRDNKEALSKRFWELEYLNIFIAVGILAVFFLITPNLNYSQYYLIESLMIIAALLDISWLYIGLEDFGKISLANFIVKVVSFMLIVYLVHNEGDLWKYIFIQSISTLLSQSVLWLPLRNKVSYMLVSLKDIWRHFMPACHYFISKIAITLYTNLNKTLLGIFGTAAAVGFYSNSLTLVTILVTLVTSVDEALLPRMSSLNAKGDEKQMHAILQKTIHLSMYFTIPLMFGIVVVTDQLVDWFFGYKFNFIKSIIPIFAPLVVIMPLGISIARQYLVPKGEIKSYNLSVIYSAIISVIINIILVPKYGIYGSIIATMVSETLVTVVRVVDLLKNTTFRFEYSRIIKIILCSGVMAVTVFYFTNSWSSSIVTTLLQGMLGAVVYFVTTYIMGVRLPFKIFKR